MNSQAKQDREHLRWLSIFHYVVAGMVALFSMFPVIHLALGLAMLSGALDGDSGEGPPKALGLIFTLIPAVIIFMGLTSAALIALAGRSLQQREHHTFCVVIAGLCCMIMPFGTVLGVFTFLVLFRPSVKELFGVSMETEDEPEEEQHSY